MNWFGLKRRLAAIQLLVLDVDGVLTDGGLFYGADGSVQRRFDVRDGLGLKLLQQQTNVHLALLSGGIGAATEQRAKHLGIGHCFTAVEEKQQVLAELQQQLGVSTAQTAYCGDDLNDLVVRPFVGVLVTPANGCIAIKRKADLVLNQRGGDGAVRELVE
ncbi:MAG: phosphatase, partial [Synechococcaceae bacterium WB6_1A_059]|nr:phosphatase [Synechococcaceae bacterium WB6_1A_059]